jgi:hypothetical protein
MSHMDLKRNTEQFLAFAANYEATRLRPGPSLNTHHALDAACEQIARVKWADILGIRGERLALWSQEARDFAEVQAAVSEALTETSPTAQVIPFTVNGRTVEAHFNVVAAE